MQEKTFWKGSKALCSFLIILIFLGILTKNPIAIYNHQHEIESSEHQQEFAIPYSQIDNYTSLELIEPVNFLNESVVATYASKGDGSSWENAYVIKNYVVNQNQTDFGFSFTNLRSYIILRNILFYNYVPGFVRDPSNQSIIHLEEPSSVLIHNSTNIRIENCDFRAYSERVTRGIKVVNSSAISITNVNIKRFFVGIHIQDSHSCVINESKLFDQQEIHIYLKDVSEIECHNTYAGEDSGFGHDYANPYAIYGSQISSLELNTNDFSLMQTFLYQATDTLLVNNELKNLHLGEVIEVRVEENLILGGLVISTGRNITILSNTITSGNYGMAVYAWSGSDVGLRGYNVYGIEITNNTFRDIYGFIFEFNYYSMAPYTDNPLWLNPPQTYNNIISKNTIYLGGSGLWKSKPEQFQVSQNLIIPHIGYFFFFIVLVYIGYLVFKSMFIHRKKRQFLHSTIDQISPHKKSGKQEQPITEPQQMQNYTANLHILEQTEYSKFHLMITGISIVVGLYWIFTFREILLTGSANASILAFFLNVNYENDPMLMIFLTNASILIIGLLACIFTRIILNRRNRPPKIMINQNFHLTSKEKRLTLLGSVAISLILCFPIILHYRGTYVGITLYFGLLAGLMFIFKFITYFMNKKRGNRIGFGIDFLIVAIILITAYFIIKKGINPEIIYGEVPDHFKDVFPALSLSLWIGGIIRGIKFYLFSFNNQYNVGETSK